MRTARVAAGVCLALAMLFPNTHAQGQENRVVFLHYWTGALSGGIDAMIRMAAPDMEGMTIRATGFEHESFKVGIRVMLDSGNPPDMFSYWAGARIRSLVDAGQLAPIDDVWESTGLDGVFSETVRQACTYDGKVYALPVTQHYVAFFYNKSIFERYGLVPPSTWEGFLDICRVLKREGQIPIALGSRNRWPAQFWFDYLLLRTAGPDYRERLMRGEASYTDPEVAKVFDIWGDMLRQGFFMESPNVYDWSEAAKAVYGGEAAMTLMGTWIIGLFEGQLGWEQGDGYDFFPMPVMDPAVRDVALGPIDAIVIAREGKVEAAKRAIAIFAGVNAQIGMSQGSGALSPHGRVPRDVYTELQRRVLEAIDRAEAWAFNYDLATPPEVAEIGLDCFTRFVDNPGDAEALLAQTQELAAQALRDSR